MYNRPSRNNNEGRTHHGTKKGPGRFNRLRAFSRKRLVTQTTGGNWQGQGYLSYAESDRVTREMLANQDDDPMLSNKRIRETAEERFKFQRSRGEA